MFRFLRQRKLAVQMIQGGQFADGKERLPQSLCQRVGLLRVGWRLLEGGGGFQGVLENVFLPEGEQVILFRLL